MRHVLVAGAVAAAALLMGGAVPRPAEALPIAKLQLSPGSGVTLARHGGHGGHHGGGHHGGGHHGGGHHGGGHHAHHGGGRRGGIAHLRGHRGRHHRGSRFRIYRNYDYAPYYYGYYDDSCAWLRRKALRTDSAYWWRRYDRCLDYYY